MIRSTYYTKTPVKLGRTPASLYKSSSALRVRTAEIRLRLALYVADRTSPQMIIELMNAEESTDTSAGRTRVARYEIDKKSS